MINKILPLPLNCLQVLRLEILFLVLGRPPCPRLQNNWHALIAEPDKRSLPLIFDILPIEDIVNTKISYMNIKDKTRKRTFHGRMSHSTVSTTTVSTKKTRPTLVN